MKRLHVLALSAALLLARGLLRLRQQDRRIQGRPGARRAAPRSSARAHRADDGRPLFDSGSARPDDFFGLQPEAGGDGRGAEDAHGAAEIRGREARALRRPALAGREGRAREGLARGARVLDRHRLQAAARGPGTGPHGDRLVRGPLQDPDGHRAPHHRARHRWPVLDPAPRQVPHAPGEGASSRARPRSS